MTPQQALVRVIEHREIFHEEMLSLMRQIMSGEISPTLIAAITIGLRVKKETIGEIAAAAQVMREFATMVPLGVARISGSLPTFPRRMTLLTLFAITIVSPNRCRRVLAANSEE